VAVFIILFKRVVEQHRRRMEAMRALLNVCHGCGSVQGSDGHWIQFDRLAVPKVRLLCECPECSRVAAAVDSSRKAEAGRQGGSEQPWQSEKPDRRKPIHRERDN